MTLLKADFEFGAMAVKALAVAAESRATERMRMIEWMTRTMLVSYNCEEFVGGELVSTYRGRVGVDLVDQYISTCEFYDNKYVSDKNTASFERILLALVSLFALCVADKIGLLFRFLNSLILLCHVGVFFIFNTSSPSASTAYDAFSKLSTK